jgi:hypothetical protein
MQERINALNADTAATGDEGLWLDGGKALCFEDVLSRFDVGALRGYYRSGALENWLADRAPTQERCAEALSRLVNIDRHQDYPDKTLLLRYVFGLREDLPAVSTDFTRRRRYLGNPDMIEENYFGSFVYAGAALGKTKQVQAAASIIIPESGGDLCISSGAWAESGSFAKTSGAGSLSGGTSAGAAAKTADIGHEPGRGGIAADSLLCRYGYGIYLI